MRSRFIAGIGAIGLAAGTATIAHAVANDTVYDTLSYTVNELDYDVTDLFSEQEIPDSRYGNGLNQSFVWQINPVYALSAEGPDDAETLSVPNIIYPDNPTSTFLFGLATNLPGDDTSGEEHLVLFANDAFAHAAAGLDWSALFPNSSEADLISEVESLIADPDLQDWNDLFVFLGGDALNAGVGFAPGDTFTAIAFSDGLIIGTGVSSESVSSSSSTPTPVPEPSTWAMLAAGFLSLAWLGLRRKRDLSVVQ